MVGSIKDIAALQCRDTCTRSGSGSQNQLQLYHGFRNTSNHPQEGRAVKLQQQGETALPLGSRARGERQQVRPDCRLIIPLIILASHLQNRHNAKSALPVQASETGEHHGCGIWQSLSNKNSYGPPKHNLVLKVLYLALADDLLLGACGHSQLDN